MEYKNLNSFQRQALTDLREACFDAIPHANWILVSDGHEWEPVFTTQGVDLYIANNVPLTFE